MVSSDYVSHSRYIIHQLKKIKNALFKDVAIKLFSSNPINYLSKLLHAFQYKLSSFEKSNLKTQNVI